MATPAPEGLDVTDLKFKLQNKVPIFSGDGNVKDSYNLLAAASVYGLILAGTTTAHLRVLQLKDITSDRVLDEVVPLRTIPMPSEISQMALSCDHGFLAVDVIVNGVPVIYIYSVPSFLTPSVVKLHEIRTSPEGGIRSTQILWNPVIHNMFSVRTQNSALSVYSLKEPSGLEFHSLDKSEGAICACWSPKGKQLVVGFANGKLVQYKPDLKPARTIICPDGVLEGKFDVIAVQWLSTYQFAAVFMPVAVDSVPALFIVNAPKAGSPTFINYDDICYSQSGPRKGQVFLIHILPWNLLLMASTNSMEVGILGTTESGETPTWCQWTTTDEARAELPLTSDKQESFPIGFALETGCTHQVTIGEQTFPVMPMIHLLSTYGLLVSFNVLNLTPNIPSICSPPKPVMDTSGKFEKIDFSKGPGPTAGTGAAQTGESSFAVPTGATSTPVVPKTKAFFNPTENKAALNLFSQTSVASTVNQVSAPVTSVEPAKNNIFGSNTVAPFGGQAFAIPQTQQSLLKTTLAQPQKSQEATKPLVTVPPTYTPPPATDVTRSSSTGNLSQQAQKPVQKKADVSDDTNFVIRTMIIEEIRKFEKELHDLRNRCKTVSITVGTKDESASIIKNLKELQDLSVQAAESTDSLGSDVQALRLGLNEAFAMVAEANSKNSIFKHPSPNQFQETHAMSQSSRRQLASLQNMLALNVNQLQIVNKQIDAQWSAIQEASRLNSRRRMHVPSLEVLYQTLSKQQEILNRQREKLSYIKGKLGMRENIRGLDKARGKDLMADNEAAIDSLTDSIVSMTIADQVREDARRLSEAKMSSLRTMLRNRKVVTIKPGRPDRVGINSEVVRERRNEARRVNLAKEKGVPKPTTIVPAVAKRTEEKSKVQPKVAPAKAASPGAESTKVFELPKATHLPPFGHKPSPVPPVQTISAGSAAQPSATTVASSFAPSPAAPITTAKSPAIFGANATTVSAGSTIPVFSFGQVAQPFGSFKPKEPNITKETTIFGNTTIKPVPAAIPKNKENQEPAAGFGLGNTTVTPVAKTDDLPPALESTKPVVSFGPNSNSKTSAFTFGSCTGEPLTFGTSQPAAAAVPAQPSAPALNLAKEKDRESQKENKQDDVIKKEETIASSNDTPSAEKGAKAAYPVITNLLQKVEPSKSEIAKPQSTFGVDAKTAASTIFGTSTATIAPGTGIFGTIKNTDTTASTTTTITATSTSSSGLFSTLSFGATAITPTPFSSASISTTESAPTIDIATTTSSNLFASIKPTTAATSSSGFSFANIGTVTKPTDLSIKSEASNAKFSFGGSSTTFATIATTAVTTTATVTTTASSASTVTSTVSTTIPSSTVASVSAPITTSTAPATASDGTTPVIVTVASIATAQAVSTVPAVVTTSTPAADTTTNLFGSFNICSPTTTAASKPASSHIFGTGSFSAPKGETISIFGGSTTTTPAFGATPVEASKPSSVFGTAAVATSTSTAGTGLFGTVTSTTGSSIFGGSSASNSPFGTTGGLFGSVATSVAAPTASVGSIFGGGATSPQQPSSTFGSAVTATPATSGSNIFGSSSSTTGGLFGAVSPAPAAGGSIFGGTSAFGSANTSTGNIFGTGTAGATTGIFGSSAFEQPSSPQPAQSIFGGSSSTAGFGSTGFGSPAASAGAFSQPAGGTVAQTGFGSPTSSAFNRPGFGSTPTFGGAPTFGGTPSFGGVPAFGSPPAFASASGFGQAPLSPSTQSSNLFEQLGSSSTGMSFGNLAQQPAQKPAQFGGSSFSSWRS